jgi:hypothetical protein
LRWATTLIHPHAAADLPAEGELPFDDHLATVSTISTSAGLA